MLKKYFEFEFEFELEKHFSSEACEKMSLSQVEPIVKHYKLYSEKSGGSIVFLTNPADGPTSE